MGTIFRDAIPKFVHFHTWLTFIHVEMTVTVDVKPRCDLNLRQFEIVMLLWGNKAFS